MDVEGLVARIDGDLSGLRAAQQEAGVLTKKTTGDMGKQWKGVAGPVGSAEQAVRGLKAVIGALAVRELYQATRGSLQFSASIKDVSLQTKFSIEALQEYRFAAGQLGVEANTLDSALSRMTVSIGKARIQGGESAKVFRRLGLDVNAIGEGEQAFEAILEGLRSIEDPTQRAARAFQIFGREPHRARIAAVTGRCDHRQGRRGAARSVADSRCRAIGADGTGVAHDRSGAAAVRRSLHGSGAW
jgi:hypothetical protein